MYLTSTVIYIWLFQNIAYDMLLSYVCFIWVYIYRGYGVLRTGLTFKSCSMEWYASLVKLFLLMFNLLVKSTSDHDSQRSDM